MAGDETAETAETATPAIPLPSASPVPTIPAHATIARSIPAWAHAAITIHGAVGMLKKERKKTKCLLFVSWTNFVFLEPFF
jgi:hypothetical protein